MQAPQNPQQQVMQQIPQQQVMQQIPQQQVMSKTPLFVMVGSGVIILISLIMIGIGLGDITDIDVESEAIFQGTSGSVSVEEYGTYTILVDDHYRCDETTVSITDGSTEFFTPECDRDFDEVGWRSVGVMGADSNGELSVTSNHEIIIVDDIIYWSGGGDLMMGGGGLCCIGIIGLVVGIVMVSKKKGNAGAQYVFIQEPMMQHQQPMQQPQQAMQQPMQQEYQKPPPGL